MSDLKGKKILVVDDNETNRVNLKHQLENWNIDVELASSGENALNILSENISFDLVLTDMKMPFMDGAMLARSIREKYSLLPIILLNSIGNDCKIQNLFNSILAKPIKQHLLSKHILSVLQHENKTASQEKSVQQKLPVHLSDSYPLDILIAEDNLINQHVIVHILEKMGYKPAVVENGIEAVKAATKRHFDIILMDMQMPEMDGLEATRVLRQALEVQPVIIALTANAMPCDKQKCLNGGMDDYLGKPVKLEELVLKLEKWSLYRANLPFT